MSSNVKWGSRNSNFLRATHGRSLPISSQNWRFFLVFVFCSPSAWFIWWIHITCFVLLLLLLARLCFSLLFLEMCVQPPSAEEIWGIFGSKFDRISRQTLRIILSKIQVTFSNFWAKFRPNFKRNFGPSLSQSWIWLLTNFKAKFWANFVRTFTNFWAKFHENFELNSGPIFDQMFD